jgi:hypothetical protein
MSGPDEKLPCESQNLHTANIDLYDMSLKDKAPSNLNFESEFELIRWLGEHGP